LNEQETAKKPRVADAREATKELHQPHPEEARSAVAIARVTPAL
jgi:hypothetical protein